MPMARWMLPLRRRILTCVAARVWLCMRVRVCVWGGGGGHTSWRDLQVKPCSLCSFVQAAVRASLEELELAKGEGDLELAELEAAIAASLALEVRGTQHIYRCSPG